MNIRLNRFLLSWGLLVIISITYNKDVQAQILLNTPDWEILADSVDWLSVSDSRTRGLAANPATGNIIVVTRAGSTAIKVINPVDGSIVRNLDADVISGGFWPVNRIAITDDGQIFVTNFSLNGPEHRIYWWANEEAQAKMIWDGNPLEGRVGDGIAISGTGDDIKVYVSGYAQYQIAELSWNANEEILTGPRLIDLPIQEDLYYSLAMASDEKALWINGRDLPIVKIDIDGNLLNQIPQDLVANGNHELNIMTVDGRSFLFTGVPGPEENFFTMIDITDENDPYVIAKTKNLTIHPNEWQMGGVVYDQTTSSLTILVTNSGIFNFNIQKVFTDPFTADNWQLGIDLSLEQYSANVIIGVDSLATDGFDPDFDIPAPPIPPDNHIRAVFSYPEWNNELGDDFVSDIRASRDLSEIPLEWTLKVTSPVIGSATLKINRPFGFTLPIAVNDGDWTISREGDLLLDFDHNGEKTWEFTIQVGDTTAPELSTGTLFEGPKIWSSTIERSFEWQASDANHLEQVILEHSKDDGTTWDTLYVGLQEQYDWMPSDELFNEKNRFRLTAYDRVGNTSSYTTKTPITIVSEQQPLSFAKGWNMVGAPYLDMEEQILSNAYRFEWDITSYQEITEYESGKGYWLGALEAGADTLKGTIAENTVKIDILQGWAMISSPFMRTVYLDSVVVTNLDNEQSLSYGQAVDQQWITAPLAYRGSAYTTIDELKPFEGYWVGVYEESVRLSLPIHRYAEVDDSMDKILLSAQIEPENVIELMINTTGLSQRLTIGDPLIQHLPAPPAAPNTPRLGIKGSPTILGDLYLQLGTEVDEPVAIPLYRSDDSMEFAINWKDQPWGEINAVLLLSDGEQYNLLEAGSVVIDSEEDMPSILLSPKLVSTQEPEVLPTSYKLIQNYPNPFNPSTQIRFALPEQAHVNLAVYNMLGQRVKTLVNETRSPGWHDVIFDASGLSSGVFIYRLKADGYVETKSMMFVK